jgi:hypothetical protein
MLLVVSDIGLFWGVVLVMANLVLRILPKWKILKWVLRQVNLLINLMVYCLLVNKTVLSQCSVVLLHLLAGPGIV